ncbi:hypothetical protein RI129_002979 [Pyrocoelia pectoralis]|uniref:Protein phosphatase 1 regulatory subunit 15A/B C-terminal domain-containing protein n=2 Tax=Lampyridae TaxID=7049 RepID=A0AAN7VHE4_9COLE
MLLDSSANKAEPTITNISSILLTEIKVIWSKSSIPIVSDQQILHLIKEFHKKYRNVKKPIKNRKTDHLNSKLNNFKNVYENKLFDISLCKCKNISLCSCKIKVPVRERTFLSDQRSERKMVIGSVDRATTKRIERAAYRKATETTTAARSSDLNECHLFPKPSTSKGFIDEGSGNESSDKNSSGEVEMNNSRIEANRCDSLQNTNQMRVKLPSLAQACDRTGVSDRSAATIVSAVLKDLGLINEDRTEKIIDRSKVRRERKKNRDNDTMKTLAGIPCFEEFKAFGTLKFIVLQFHEYFDALIGIRDLKKLKFNIDLQNDLLTRSDGNNFSLYYNKPSNIKVLPHSKQIHTVSYCKSNQDIFIQEQRLNKIILNEGLYKIYNGNVNIILGNTTNDEQEIEIDQLNEEPIDPEEVIFDESRNKVHVMVVWCFAYTEARKGPWQTMALDRYRFHRRIEQLNRILSPVLQENHRAEVYHKRFQGH